MKTSFHVKLLSTALLSLWLVNGCASNSANGGSKASADAAAAIKNANDAIKVANGNNNWIWRDTEDFVKQANEAAAAGDNAKAIKLANTAQFEAEAAVEQYNLETTHQRSLR
jgi:hypothetical protein